jgi:hypothetical protein
MEKIGIPADNCPMAPPPRVTVYTRVLHRACQIAGGVTQLARHLKVSRSLLHAWLEGEEVPPPAIFLQAVDLILPTWGPEDDALAKAIAATRPKKN